MEKWITQLKNDQMVYDYLKQSGALSGEAVPALEQIAEQTGLDADTVLATLERYCQQRLLQKDEQGWYRQYPQPLYIHYKSFRAFRQLLESADSSVSVELITAVPMEPDSYTSEVLHLKKGEKIIHILRLYTRGSVPFAYEEYDVLYDLLKNTPKADLDKYSILQAIEKNLPLAERPAQDSIVQSQYFNMMPVGEGDRKYLQMEDGESVIRIIGRGYFGENPVCSFQIRFNPALVFLKHQGRVPE